MKYLFIFLSIKILIKFFEAIFRKKSIEFPIGYTDLFCSSLLNYLGEPNSSSSLFQFQQKILSQKNLEYNFIFIVRSNNKNSSLEFLLFE